MISPGCTYLSYSQTQHVCTHAHLLTMWHRETLRPRRANPVPLPPDMSSSACPVTSPRIHNTRNADHTSALWQGYLTAVPLEEAIPILEEKLGARLKSVGPWPVKNKRLANIVERRPGTGGTVTKMVRLIHLTAVMISPSSEMHTL